MLIFPVFFFLMTHLGQIQSLYSNTFFCNHKTFLLVVVVVGGGGYWGDGGGVSGC